MRKRTRQPSQEEINRLPDIIKNTLSDDGVIQLANDVQRNANIPKPDFGEVTYTGTNRITGSGSSFNIYGSLGLYDTANIPLNVLDTMRRDYQIALGMSIVKYPIVNLGFTISCKNPAIEQFMKTVIAPLWSDFLRDSLLSLDYGFTTFEKVWKSVRMDVDPGNNKHKIRDRDFIVLKKLKPINPKTINLRVNGLGNFTGITQTNASLSGNDIDMDLQKSMLITYQKEYGNYFGKSRMLPAYEAWYWKMISVQFFLRWMERHAIPPYKASYPKGHTIMGETQISNADLAMNFIKGLGSYGNIIIPSDVDDKGNKKWDINAVEQSRQNLTLDKIVGVWNVAILRGLLIPDAQSLGSLNSEMATEIFLSTIGDQVLNIQTVFNKEIIQPLLVWNFTPEERELCALNIDDVDLNKREEMRKLMSKVLDLSATFIKQKGGLPYDTFPDVEKMYKILDVPSNPLKIFVPPIIDPEGNIVKEKTNKPNDANKGPDKGEETPGNKSRIGRDGNPRDEDKNDQSNL